LNKNSTANSFKYENLNSKPQNKKGGKWKMPEWYDKKLLGTGAIIAIIVVALFYGIPWLQQQMAITAPTPAPGYLYTQDLTVNFKIMDDTSASLLTSSVKPLFFSAGTNPFDYTFLGSPVAAATYDTTTGFWTTVLSMGSYVVLVTDEAGSKTMYPIMVSVSVPGTNDTKMEVMLNPSMLHMVERATPTISRTIYAYNTASGAYDISVTNINVTTYSKWQVDYRFTLAGIGKAVKGGRIYLTSYTGLTVAGAALDGTQVPVYTDTDSSDDGQVGNYIVFPDWTAGTHYLTVYIAKTGTPAAGTYTLTLFEYYTCLQPALRWWTDQTSSISVVKASS